MNFLSGLPLILSLKRVRVCLLSVLSILHTALVIHAEDEALLPTVINTGTEEKPAYAALTPDGWVGDRVWFGMGEFREQVCTVQAEENGKWGVMDMTGNLVVPVEYDTVSDCCNGLIAVKKGNACGFLKADGTVALPLTTNWEDASAFSSQGLAPVKFKASGGLWGYIRTDGSVAIPPRFDEARSFPASGAPARVQKGGKWGFIDANGTEVISCQYATVGNFTDNPPLAAVQNQKSGHWGFINPKGEFVIPLKYREAAGFSEGFCDVNLEGKWVLIDTVGQLIDAIKAEEVWTPARGLAMVRMGKSHGLARLDGTMAEPAKWKRIYHSAGTHTVVQADSEAVLGLYAVRGTDSKLSAWFTAPTPEVRATAPFLRIDAGMHTASVSSVSTDASGSLVLTSSKDKTAKLWKLDRNSSPPSTTLLRTLRPLIDESDEGVLYACALSPDGKLAVVGGWTGGDAAAYRKYLYHFDTATGHLLRRLPTYTVIYEVKFSPSGKRLASACFSELRVTDFATGSLLGRAIDMRSLVFGIEWLGEDRLVTTCDDGKLRLYRLDEQGLVLVHTQATTASKHPRSVRVSPDGSRLAVTYEDSTAVTLHSAADLSLIKKLETTSGSEGFRATCWLKDGRLAAAGDWKKLIDNAWTFPIRIWPISALKPGKSNGQPVDLPTVQSTIYDLQALPAGGLVFAAGTPEWGVALPDHSGSLNAITLGMSPIADLRSNEGLLTSSDGSAIAFDFTFQSSSAIFSIPQQKLIVLKDASAVPDTLHKSRSSSERLKITDWNSTEGPKLNGEPLTREEGEICRSLVIARDDSHFVLGTSFNLRAYTALGAERWKVNAPVDVWAVNLTQDGKLAVAAYGDGTIRWHDMNDGRELLAFFPHADKKRWVLWTPEGYFTCSAGAENLIGWHVNRGPDREADFYPAEQLYANFYRPDIVQEVLKQRRGAGEIAKDMGITFSLEAALKKVPVVKLQGASDGETMGTDTAVILLEAWDTGGGVKDISLFHNGKRIPQDGPGQRRGEVRTLSYTVMLQPGENELKAQAANDAGTISNPAVARVKFNGVQATSTLHLLTIGLNRYQNPKYNLTYCVPDADACAEAFAKRAPGLFAEVKSYALRDDQATKPKIEETFGQIAKAAKPSDVFIFCYAGHGVMGEKPEGKPGDNEFYLLPHDVTRMYGDPEMLAEKGVSKADLETWCTNIPARKQIMLLDTCQSGGLVDTYAMRGVAEEKAIAMLARASGTMVIASTGAEAYARESKDIGHGIFTKALLDGLLDAKADADKDGKITVKEIDTYIGSAVPELSQKLVNSPQFPTSYARGQDFPIGIVK